MVQVTKKSCSCYVVGDDDSFGELDERHRRMVKSEVNMARQRMGGYIYKCHVANLLSFSYSNLGAPQENGEAGRGKAVTRHLGGDCYKRRCSVKSPGRPQGQCPFGPFVALYFVAHLVRNYEWSGRDDSTVPGERSIAAQHKGSQIQASWLDRWGWLRGEIPIPPHELPRVPFAPVPRSQAATSASARNHVACPQVRRSQWRRELRTWAMGEGWYRLQPCVS